VSQTSQWKKYLSKAATAKQAAAVERLSGQIRWATHFYNWLEKRFKRDERTVSIERIIDALERKLRNQKSPATVPDVAQPASAEQLATIGRLSRQITWPGSFDGWLRRKHHLERIELSSQADKVITTLKERLRAQLLEPVAQAQGEGHPAAKRTFQ